MVAAALLLALAFFRGALGAFPSSFGSCAEFANYVPLSGGNLPPLLERALNDADLAAALIQSQGVDPVSTGLYSSATVGLSVGIVYGQELLFAKGYGLRNANDTSSKIDANSIFRIGSISKVFAMLSMMVLRDRGMLALDDEIVKYVPEFTIQSPFPPSKRSITFRQLATHMAGMPRESPCSTDASCEITNAEALARIANFTLILPPDTMPIYSNLGFDVLGQTLAVIYGKPYETMVDELIVRPLGLKNTGVNITKADTSRLAWPYVYDTAYSNPYFCGDACLGDFGWGNPAGAMYSSVADLAQIIQLIFRDSAEAGITPNQILDGATIRETLKPQYITRDRQGGYAMTWELYQIGDYMIRTKRGDVDGYASEIIMVPEMQLGIVVLANMVEHAQFTAQTLTNILLPAFDQALHYLKTEQPPPAPPLPLAAYLGTYGTGDNAVHVTLDGSRQRLLFDYLPSQLEYLTNSTAPLGGAEGATTALHVFRMMPWPGMNFGPAAPSCWNTQSDDWWETVKFNVVNGNVVSLVIDVQWGTSFVKQ